MAALSLSRDRKVSPVGRDAGILRATGRPRGFVATLANSFGLPAGYTCPGATPFCASCYAINAETYRTAVAKAMQRNLDALLEAGSVQGMAALLCDALDRFRAAFDRQDPPERDRVFRIHWDGDFFSVDYALAWRYAILHNRDVRFWVYTRSFADPVDVVPVLAELPNLALYLSTDEFNQQAALKVLERYPDVRLALCATDYRRGDLLAAGRPTHVCPENKGDLPLMDDHGRGACVECRWCIVGKRHVIFSTSHQDDVEGGQELLFGDITATRPSSVPVHIGTPPTKTHT